MRCDGPLLARFILREAFVAAEPIISLAILRHGKYGWARQTVLFIDDRPGYPIIPKDTCLRREPKHVLAITENMENYSARNRPVRRAFDIRELFAIVLQHTAGSADVQDSIGAFCKAPDMVCEGTGFCRFEGKVLNSISSHSRNGAA